MPDTAPEMTLFSRLKTKKLHVSPLVLIIGVIAYAFLAFNATFWDKGLAIFEGSIRQMGILALAVFVLNIGLYAFFNLPYILKPFLAFTLVLGSVTAYYMDSLGVIIDRSMIQNVATTTLTESKHLLTLALSLQILIYGLIPAAAMLYFVRLKPQKKWVALSFPVLVPVICVAITAGLLLSHFKTYSSVFRERRDYLGSYQPVAPMVGAVQYVKMMATNFDVVVEPLGEDAQKGPVYGPDKKPTLTIIIAGETARAQNFSLNGYSVLTNPELAQKDIVNFSNVSSCGTATATSLPCMFSKFSRQEFSFSKGVSTENLLDVLTYAGFKVEWWDNNTGDKAVAARVPVTFLTQSDNQQFCGEGECTDMIFLEHLKEYLPRITGDTVLVLHHIGSHGPAYYLRYPTAFEKFKPACRTSDFLKCTAQEITNAYDNSIAYTDYSVSKLIDFLDQQQDLATSLLYVSDHGESLGESGLYLHGTPYFMAPEQQTRVPMFLWMSAPFKEKMDYGENCAKADTDRELSHDNLFHSVLGMLQVKTRVYKPELDIFADCGADQGN